MDLSHLKNDTVFNLVNKEFISLSDQSIKDNNIHLAKVIPQLMENLKKADPFFKKTFKNCIYSGSFYKGTKVNAPNEYDLLIIFELPLDYEKITFTNDRPAFIKIKTGLTKDSFISEENSTIKKFLTDDMCLDQLKFRNWVEGVITKAEKNTKTENGKNALQIDSFSYKMNTCKSGPAFTLKDVTFPNNVKVDIDLVPALKFKIDYYKKFRNHPKLQKSKCKYWYAIPKPFYQTFPDAKFYWRLCFDEQEKELLKKYGKIKPIIKHIKQMRDFQNWKNIASYYIETAFFHEMPKVKDIDKKSNTWLLWHMLTKVHEAFHNEKLMYFWDDRFNLLDKLRKEELSNIERRLQRIINSINRNISTNPFVIADNMFDPDQVLAMKKIYNS